MIKLFSKKSEKKEQEVEVQPVASAEIQALLDYVLDNYLDAECSYNFYENSKGEVIEWERKVTVKLNNQVVGFSRKSTQAFIKDKIAVIGKPDIILSKDERKLIIRMITVIERKQKVAKDKASRKELFEMFYQKGADKAHGIIVDK